MIARGRTSSATPRAACAGTALPRDEDARDEERETTNGDFEKQQIMKKFPSFAYVSLRLALPRAHARLDAPDIHVGIDPEMAQAPQLASRNAS